MALNKEKKKGCFYTVLGTCQKTFVNSCTYILSNIFDENFVKVTFTNEALKKLRIDLTQYFCLRVNVSFLPTLWICQM